MDIVMWFAVDWAPISCIHQTLGPCLVRRASLAPNRRALLMRLGPTDRLSSQFPSNSTELHLLHPNPEARIEPGKWTLGQCALVNRAAAKPVDLVSVSARRLP